MAVDGKPREPLELALGECMSPGDHVVTIRTNGRAPKDSAVQVFAGATTVAVVAEASGTYSVSTASVDARDMVEAMGAHPQPPRLSSSNSVSSLRMRGWVRKHVESLERITAAARHTHDPVAVQGASQLSGRARQLENLLSAGGRDATPATRFLRAALATAQEQASEARVLAVPHYACPVWSTAGRGPLADVSVEARTLPDPRIRVGSLRIAVDGVEVLRMQRESLSGSEWQSVANRGLMPAGTHLFTARVVWLSRNPGPYVYSLPVRVQRERSVHIPPTGSRVRVRVRVRRDAPLTSPLAERLAVDIRASDESEHSAR